MSDAAKAARRAAARLDGLAHDLHELRLQVQLEGDRGRGDPQLEDRLLDLQDEADRCFMRVAGLVWELEGGDDGVHGRNEA
jgi:hypothetical protein